MLEIAGVSQQAHSFLIQKDIVQERPRQCYCASSVLTVNLLLIASHAAGRTHTKLH